MTNTYKVHIFPNANTSQNLPSSAFYFTLEQCAPIKLQERPGGSQVVVDPRNLYSEHKAIIIFEMILGTNISIKNK